MGLYINTNVAAQGTSTTLRGLSDHLAKGQQRLAAGTKSVSDDASSASVGFAISATIGSLSQASSNAAQGSALLQLGMAALSSTEAVFQRMNQLAAQANSDSIDDTRRGMIDQEFQKLLIQVDTNAATKWFSTSLFSGSAATSTGSAVTATAALVAVANAFNSSVPTIAGFVNGAVSNAVTTATGVANTYSVSVQVGNQTFTNLAVTGDNAGNFTLTSTSNSNNTISLAFDTAATSTAVKNNLANNFAANLATALGATFQSGEISLASFSGVTFDAATSGVTAGQWGVYYTYADNLGTFTLTNGAETYVQTVNASVLTPAAAETVSFSNGLSINLSTSFALQTNSGTLNAPHSINITAGTLPTFAFQTGQASSDTTSVSFTGASASALSLTGIDVTTTTNAAAATTAILTAMTTVATQIAVLGGVNSQLGYLSDNLAASIQNQTATRATFTDIDVATELTDVQRLNANIQVAQTMFTQSMKSFSSKAELVQSAAR